MCSYFFWMTTSSFISSVTISVPSPMLLHGGVGGMSDWELIVFSSGCSIDWERSHASKPYVVSFVASTSGKRTLERDAPICFYSDKEASQASISPAWRTHHPISTSRRWSHQALSLRALPAPDSGLFEHHAANHHQQVICISTVFLLFAESGCKSVMTWIVTHCIFTQCINHIPLSGDNSLFRFG